MMTLEDFRKKYGRIGWQLPLKEFITRAPSFQGDTQLAQVLEEIMADLETALEEANNG